MGKIDVESRVGVVFSSGFFGFFAHGGFLEALEELGIRVSGYAGTSSGAIAAAMGASGMRAEDIKQMLFGLKKADFWDPDPWHVLIRCLLSMFKGYGGLLEGKKFLSILGRLPASTFEQCKSPLVVVATNITENRGEIFRSGSIPLAVAASGAVPMLFKPVRIGQSLYVDGGLVCKAPVMALAQEVRPKAISVHYITSTNLERAPNYFLRKKFTPWHIQQQATSIARHRAYQMEVALAESMGIRVVEISTKTPPLGPNKLARGPQAYRHAREQALEKLKSVFY